MYLEPTTTSAYSDFIGSRSFGISEGSCWPSASIVITMSGSYLRHSINPLFKATPLPMLRLFLTTFAFKVVAISLVLSTEPSSTTIIEFTNLLVSAITEPILLDSLYAGMTAITKGSFCFARSEAVISAVF